ncbi:putative bifunctional diguanylate cyclase/phosphodiesterase [Rhizobium sp. SGZ-381]|uniref:putative bifunctional diguanylate cyclase/phosphodiesterase n=1 Tax=Rhizobium sp. SGZ-381 TaxID=3342800 RepID=UPI00366BFDF5
MRFVPITLKHSAAKVDRRSAVRSMLLIFAAVVIAVTGMVFTALDRVGHYANQLDEERSRESVSGALLTFQRQLAATLHDYAAWDDAADNVYRLSGLGWARRNFGAMTEKNELFDVAIIVDHAGRVVFGYAEGQPVTEHFEDYITPDVRSLLEQTRAAGEGLLPEATSFTRTARGTAAFGVGLIRMKSGARVAPPDEGRYVIFMRHLTGPTIERLASAYVLPGLRIEEPQEHRSHRVDILSPSGRAIGALSWEPRSPGNVSLAQVRPLVWCAVAMVAIYFVLLFVSGSQALARLAADEEAAIKLSLTDRLSGLPNRTGLFSDLSELVADAQKSRRDVALLYLDLDGFKEVNDAYGHATGDELIRAVSAGLSALVGEKAVLARLGGDEFAIGFLSRTAEADAAQLAERVMEFLGAPLSMGDRIAVVGCSIGIACSPLGTVPGEEVLRRADMAMYRAKEEGRGRWSAYSPAMDAEREERNRLEVDLRQAIERQEISVAFQPVVEAQHMRLSGVEALARWTRPGHGPVRPDVFIPIAESTGLIDQLGLCVLRTACEALRDWPELTLAVNISPGQFRDPAFAERVAEVFEQTEMDPARVTLEMTETYFIQNPARARDTLGRLKKTGVNIALDDFGAGFSSVGYLRQFGFDRMKIDRSLVAAADLGGRAVDMLQATVALARSLDIPVTAEGVETDAQAVALRIAGCDQLQGFLFGKPVPIAEIARLRGLEEPLFRLSGSA